MLIAIVISTIIVLIAAKKILQLINEREIDTVNPHEIDLVGRTEALEKINKSNIAKLRKNDNHDINL